MSRLSAILATAIAVAMVSATTFAATGSFVSSSPDPLNFLLTPGGSSTGSVSTQVNISGSGNVDVFFLTDTTGSMFSAISSIKTSFPTVVTNLETALPAVDFRYGVADFKDRSDGAPYASNHGLKVGQNVTADLTAVQTAINAWSATGGGDLPEANLGALKELAEGWISTYGGRDSAQKIIIYTADINGWENGAFGFDYPTLQSTIDALVSRGAKVFALSNRPAGSGLDAVGPANSTGSGGPPDGRQQGTAIVDATGGLLLNNVDYSDADGIAAQIESSITTGTETINNVTVTVLGDLGSWVLDVSDSPVPGGPFDSSDSPLLSNFGLAVNAPSFADFRTVMLELRADGALLDTLTVTLSTGGSAVIPLPPAVLMGLATMGVAGVATMKKRRSA